MLSGMTDPVPGSPTPAAGVRARAREQMRDAILATARTHLAAWQGCIVEGRNFVADPTGFLANAA